MSTPTVDLSIAIEETKLALAALRVASELQTRGNPAAVHENVLGSLFAIERAAAKLRDVIAAHGFTYGQVGGGE